MLKVWGRANSINVQKVLWCASELGVEFERIDFGGVFGGTDTPEYRAMNPMGLIPTIDDDGVILWESHTCARYLAAKNNSDGLWPDNVSVRAEAEKWMNLVFKGLIRTPEAERDMVAISEAKEQMQGFWGIVDSRLADREFLTGNGISIGDIAIGPYAFRWFGLFGDEVALPNVKSWFERLKLRNGYCQYVVQPLS